MKTDHIVSSMIALIQHYPTVAKILNLESSEIQKTISAHALTGMFDLLQRHNILDLFGEISITDITRKIEEEEKAEKENEGKEQQIEENKKAIPNTELEAFFLITAKVLYKLEHDEVKRSAFFSKDQKKPTDELVLCVLAVHYAQGASSLSIDRPYNLVSFRRLHEEIAFRNAHTAQEWVKKQCYLLWVLDKIDSPHPKTDKAEFADSTSPLHEAINENSIKKIKAYVAKHGNDDALMNFKGAKLFTPLHLAIDLKNADAVAALLEAPAINVNIRTYTGETALHLAIRRNLTSSIPLILAHKPDLSLTNDRGLSILSLSLLGDKPELTALLLIHNAQFKKSDATYIHIYYSNNVANYTTLLHLAAKHGLSTVVDQLISLGARLNERDHEGQTPYECAVDGQHKEVAEKLKNAMNASILANAMITLIEHYLGSSSTLLPDLNERGKLTQQLATFINLLNTHKIIDLASPRPQQPIYKFDFDLASSHLQLLTTTQKTKSGPIEIFTLLTRSADPTCDAEEVLNFLATILYKLKPITHCDAFFKHTGEVNFPSTTPMTAGLLCAQTIRLAALIGVRSQDNPFTINTYRIGYIKSFDSKSITIKDWRQWEHRCLQLLNIIHPSTESNFIGLEREPTGLHLVSLNVPSIVADERTSKTQQQINDEQKIHKAQQQKASQLVTWGYDVNAPMWRVENSANQIIIRGGSTPIHLAAHKGHTWVMEELLKAKIKLPCVDDEGLSPFYDAIFQNHIGIARMLFEAGIRPTAKDATLQREGKDPLLHVALKYIPKTMEVMLHGNDGKSYQASFAHVFVESLISMGADKEAKIGVFFKSTPLDTAKSYQLPSVQALLAPPESTEPPKQWSLRSFLHK